MLLFIERDPRFTLSVTMKLCSTNEQQPKQHRSTVVTAYRVIPRLLPILDSNSAFYFVYEANNRLNTSLNGSQSWEARALTSQQNG